MLFAPLKSCVAHRNAWEVAGVFHRDISVNNIMILESMEPDGMIGSLAVLCDFDLCTYLEHWEWNKEQEVSQCVVSPRFGFYSLVLMTITGHLGL